MLRAWAFKRSIWVSVFNTGGCNGCDIEILAAFIPRFDAERFGVKLAPSPRHADVLLVTGPVTRRSAPRLKRIYEQMPEPKAVVAVGACACGGGPFWTSYNVLGGAEKVVPVDVKVPGCPPRPEKIIEGIAKAGEVIACRVARKQ